MEAQQGNSDRGDDAAAGRGPQVRDGSGSPPSQDSGRGEVVVYEAPDGAVRFDVRLEHETVWLTQRQMAELFGRDRSVVAKHVANVFAEAELDPAATCAHFARVRSEGRRTVERRVDHYSLDVVISVGYRVKSRRGTQFRIWAGSVLREHLLRGFTLNERRLSRAGVDDLQQAVDLLARTLSTHGLVSDEGRALLDLVRDFSRSWSLLHEFDEGRLGPAPARPVAPRPLPDIGEVRGSIARLGDSLRARGEAGPLFGREAGDGLARILGALEQTAAGRRLYPSAQLRSAQLLYFLVKDHPFVDGNKRIGAFLFLDQLRRHGLLYAGDGRARLQDTALVALTLLLAESAPVQRELMVRLSLRMLEASSAPP